MLLDMKISGLNLLYLQEHLFRVMDYFFDKFLWALIYADPYLHIEPRKDDLIAYDQIEDYDL